MTAPETTGSAGQDRIPTTAAHRTRWWEPLAIYVGGFVGGFIACGVIFGGWQ